MDRIRIGVIGAGQRGGWFIRNKFTKMDVFQLVSVCEPDPAWIAKAFPSGVGNVRLEDDWRKVVKADDVELVCITTPDHMHEEEAIAAFKAKKHVFCEKPLALTPAGCQRVIAAAERARRKLVIGFVLRYAPLYRRTKQFIDEGAIGKLCGVWVLHSVASGSDFYFHDWHGVSENVNSLLLQKGSHDLDIVNWMVGARPRRVSAFAALQYFGGDKPNSLTCPKCPIKRTCPEFMTGPRVQCAFRREIDVNDNHVVVIDYENGVKASYNECHFTADDNREYIYIGTEGKLWMDDRAGTIRIQKRWNRQPTIEWNVRADGGHGGGDEALLDDIVKCVRGKGEPVAGAESGYFSILLADGAARSVRLGKTIDLLKAKK
jgi:predicted dehydrogenase